jgi:hypothetical protein
MENLRRVTPQKTKKRLMMIGMINGRAAAVKPAFLLRLMTCDQKVESVKSVKLNERDNLLFMLIVNACI